MDQKKITGLTLREITKRAKSGSIAPEAIVQTYLEKIDQQEPDINAFITVTGDLAKEQAVRLEAYSEDQRSQNPLYAAPIAIKDLRQGKEGVRHTMGSKLIDELGYTSPETSPVVQRLEEAGAVIIGKTNTPEFGHKGMTDNNLIGPTASPVDQSLNAGGSSGGSAAAVGAGMAAAAIGSDAGGSIRIPATLCGVFGLKPSYGLVPVKSRPNAFGKKMHHSVTGPITRTAEDAALVMDVITGMHPRDPASVPVDISFLDAIEVGTSKLQVAYSPNLDVFEVDSEIQDVIESQIERLESGETHVDTVALDHGRDMRELTAVVEETFSVSLERAAETLRQSFNIDIRDYPDKVDDTLVSFIEKADSVTTKDIATSGIVRTELFDAVEDIFVDYDILLTPTLGNVDADINPSAATEWERVLTWPFNWTGHPAASVPVGTTEDGLPVGLQVIGPRYQDDLVLVASKIVEENRSQ